MPRRRPPPPSGLSAFERGLSAESAFFDLLSRASRGRLRFARPQPDDHGVDRLVYREDSPYPLLLQPKAATRTGKRGDWQFQLDLSTVPRRLGAFFVPCFPFDLDKRAVGEWTLLVPGKEALGGRPRKGMRHITVPKNPKRTHKWGAYMLPTEAVAPTLLAALEGEWERHGGRDNGGS